MITFRLPPSAFAVIAENKEESQSYHDFCKQIVLNVLNIESPELPISNTENSSSIIERKVQTEILKHTNELYLTIESLQTQINELKKPTTPRKRTKAI